MTYHHGARNRFVHRRIYLGVLTSCLLLSAPPALLARTTYNFIPVGEVVPSAITPANAANFLVHPTAGYASDWQFGVWSVDAGGKPVVGALPSYLQGGAVLEDKGFYQRLIKDTVSGKTYVQQIITGDTTAGDDFSKAGMYSESYVLSSGGSGISVMQGLHCGAATGHCPSPDAGLLYNNQGNTGLDLLVKVRLGYFKDPRETVHITEMIYETDDPSKWASTARGTTGYSHYVDFWKGEYAVKDGAGASQSLGSFTNSVIKVQDIDPIYSYSTMVANMQFDDIQAAADKLKATDQSKFPTLASAEDYIRRYIQYRYVGVAGWREQADQGLLRQDEFGAIISGALVKAGDITYTKPYQGQFITASWNDGDEVRNYGVDQDLGFQQQGHEQVVPDGCDLNFPGDTNCTATVRYEFATTDVFQLIGNRNYNAFVGDQFQIENTDAVDPLDPFSTQSYLP